VHGQVGLPGTFIGAAVVVLVWWLVAGSAAAGRHE